MTHPTELEEGRVPDQMTIYDQLHEWATDWGVRDRAGAVTWIPQGEDIARAYVANRLRQGHYAQLVTRQRAKWKEAE